MKFYSVCIADKEWKLKVNVYNKVFHLDVCERDKS